MTEPETKSDIEVAIDHGQLYIYDQGADLDLGGAVLLAALHDAEESRRYVGSAGALVDLVTPVQWNWTAPMRIEVWTTEPVDDDSDWDHLVDIDLDVPTGLLAFQASGDDEDYVSVSVAAGCYRMRAAGRGYDETNRQGGGKDSYRVQFWPRVKDQPAALRKCWSGWEHREVREFISKVSG